MSDERPARPTPSSASGSLRLLGSAAGLWAAFGLLALAVRGGLTTSIDHAALHAARALRTAHPALVGVLRDLSGFGSTTVLFMLCGLMAGWLALRGARLQGVVVIAAAGLGFAADNLAKQIVGRARPDAADAAFVVTTYSYPSGHAAFSALAFLVLGSVLASDRPPRERRYVLAVAIAFSALVGASRVLLGVHWASDVLGGWMFGAGGALAVIAALRAARR